MNYNKYMFQQFDCNMMPQYCQPYQQSMMPWMWVAATANLFPDHPQVKLMGNNNFQVYLCQDVNILRQILLPPVSMYETQQQMNSYPKFANPYQLPMENMPQQVFEKEYSKTIMGPQPFQNQVPYNLNREVPCKVESVQSDEYNTTVLLKNAVTSPQAQNQATKEKILIDSIQSNSHNSTLNNGENALSSSYEDDKSEEEAEEPPQQEKKKRGRKKILFGKPNNDSKNIPKNYTRAIFSYIESQKEKIISLFPDVSFSDIQRKISALKRKVHSIKDMRNLWLDNEDMEAKERSLNKVVRVLSFKFIREESICYFYQSKKIKSATTILKYRQNLLRAIREPDKFTAPKFD